MKATHTSSKAVFALLSACAVLPSGVEIIRSYFARENVSSNIEPTMELSTLTLTCRIASHSTTSATSSSTIFLIAADSYADLSQASYFTIVADGLALGTTTFYIMISP